MLIGEILVNSWEIYREMAPYLLFGFLLAGICYAFLPPDFVRKRLGARGMGSVLKGALYGIPLPLCSCSTLPMAVSMKRQGASLGAVGSFLISTPQTGVDSIVVTWSILGPVFAIFRPIAAFLSGIMGGMLLDRFGQLGVGPNITDTSTEGCGCGCTSNGCTPKESAPKGRIALFLTYGLRELPEEIGGPLILGIIIGGVIEAAIPAHLIESALGPGVSGLLLAMIIGVPMYVCATSSVPIALAFLLKGASPGAAFVFLMTGPVTNTAQMSAIYSVFGRRNLILYMGIVCVSAIFFGTLLDQMVGPLDISKYLGTKEFMPYWVEIGSAALLSLLIFSALYEKMGPRLVTKRG